MVTGIARLVVPALSGAGVLVYLSSATAATGERAGFVGLPATPVVKAAPGTSTWRRGQVIRRDDGRIAFLPGPPKPRPGAEPAVFRAPLRPPDEIMALVNRLAPRYGLAPKLVLAVIETESAFRTDAVSSKGAVGLMQLIPATARRFGVANSHDAEQNLRGGMAYLRWLLSYFRGDLRLALAGYNAGEGAVRRVGGIPNYTETRNYVRRILARYGQQTHPFDSGLTPAAPFLIHKRPDTSGLSN